MKPKKHVVVLSLGAGIQSTALALLLDRGLLPGVESPRWAIFADTKAEPKSVYETLDWLSARLSYPVVTTSWGNLAKNTWKALIGMPVPERGHHKGGYIDLPVFTENGLAKRQCTGIYKIAPVKQKIRELAESAPPALTATQYLGISNNETRRAKPAREAWLTNEYPLIAHGYSRQDCQDFLDQEYAGHPVLRSACYFCPFRNKADWETIRRTEPGMYQDALAMERQMQDHPRGPWFLRAGGLQATETKRNLQGTLFENDTPMCSPS